MAVYLGSKRATVHGGTNLSSGITGNYQTKTVNPSETIVEVKADSGYDALESVTINPIRNDYVGSGVPRKTTATYIPNNTTQTIVANQFLTGIQTIKPVPTESKIITANGTYNASEGKYIDHVTVNVPNPTVTLQNKTVTPNETLQTITADADFDRLDIVTVEAILSETKTIAPSKNNQTITPSTGKYFSSVTVNGDINLDGANIISGKTIFGVSGQVIIQTYYTGTSIPDASFGKDGDLYLVTG